MIKISLRRFIWIFPMIFLFNCASPQQGNNDLEMKKTSYKLLKCLSLTDTTCISSMIDDEKNLKNKRANYNDDCSFIKKILKISGIPSVNEFFVTKAEDGGNVVYVTLISKSDTLLNIKKCDFVVYFYPDKFLKNPNKPFNYIISKELLNRDERKIIIAPDIEIN